MEMTTMETYDHNKAVKNMVRRWKRVLIEVEDLARRAQIEMTKLDCNDAALDAGFQRLKQLTNRLP